MHRRLPPPESQKRVAQPGLCVPMQSLGTRVKSLACASCYVVSTLPLALKQARKKSRPDLLHVVLVLGILAKETFFDQNSRDLNGIKSSEHAKVPDVWIEQQESGVKDYISHIDRVPDDSIGARHTQTTVGSDHPKTSSQRKFGNELNRYAEDGQGDSKLA